MSEPMKYNQFSRLIASCRDLIKSASYIFELADQGQAVPEELYVNVVRLHNCAVDYIVGYEEYKNKEVEQWLTQRKKKRNGKK